MFLIYQDNALIGCAESLYDLMGNVADVYGLIDKGDNKHLYNLACNMAKLFVIDKLDLGDNLVIRVLRHDEIVLSTDTAKLRLLKTVDELEKYGLVWDCQYVDVPSMSRCDVGHHCLILGRSGILDGKEVLCTVHQGFRIYT